MSADTFRLILVLFGGAVALAGIAGAIIVWRLQRRALDAFLAEREQRRRDFDQHASESRRRTDRSFRP